MLAIQEGLDVRVDRRLRTRRAPWQPRGVRRRGRSLRSFTTRIRSPGWFDFQPRSRGVIVFFFVSWALAGSNIFLLLCALVTAFSRSCDKKTKRKDERGKAEKITLLPSNHLSKLEIRVVRAQWQACSRNSQVNRIQRAKLSETQALTSSCFSAGNVKKLQILQGCTSRQISSRCERVTRQLTTLRGFFVYAAEHGPLKVVLSRQLIFQRLRWNSESCHVLFT